VEEVGGHERSIHEPSAIRHSGDVR
jgi:hypothetical protein